MAKESIDFVFKANTTEIDKALTGVADRLDKLGKGVSLKIEGFDIHALVKSIKDVQQALEQLGNTTNVAEFLPIIEELVDSLKEVEQAANNIDLSKPFGEILPNIKQFLQDLQNISKIFPKLDDLKLNLDISSDEITETIKSFENLSEKLDDVEKSIQNVAHTLEEDIAATSQEVLKMAENIQAMDKAIACIDPVILNTNDLNEALKTTWTELEELQEFISQPIPLNLDEDSLRAYQDDIAEASNSVLELTQKCKNLEAQIQACTTAVEKFGEIQSNINDATRSLREFGSLVGVDLGPLETSLSNLSQTIGYLPMVTTAASMGFTGMQKAAVGAIGAITKAIKANPVLAILVAITGALVAGISLWNVWNKARLEANERSSKLANTLEKQNKALREVDVNALRKRFDMQRKHEVDLQNLRIQNMKDLNEAILNMNAVQVQLIHERHKLEMDAIRTRHQFEQMMLEGTAAKEKEKTEIESKKEKVQQRGELEWKWDYETGRKEHFFKDTGEKAIDVYGDQDYGAYSSGGRYESRKLGYRTDYTQQAVDNIKRLNLKMLEDEQAISDRKIAIWEKEQQRFLEMNLMMSESETERVSKSIESISEIEGELEKLRRIQAESEFDPSKIRTWQGRRIAEVTDAEGNMRAVDLGKISVAKGINNTAEAEEKLKKILDDINATVAEGIKQKENELKTTKKDHDANLKRLATATEYRKIIDAIAVSSKNIIDQATSSKDGVNSITLKRDIDLQRQLAEKAMQEADFTGSEEEKIQLQEENAWEMDGIKRRYAVEGELEQEVFDTRIKHLNEYREFERDTWLKNIDSARKVAKLRLDAELELRSLQRQSVNKMLDMKLDLEIAQADTYGKSTLQQEREQRDIKYRMGDEQARHDLQKEQKKTQLKADEEALNERRRAEEALQKQQLAEKQRLELELINEKAEMEENWIKKEFEMRRELIAQEVEYKELLEKQAKEKAEGGDTSNHELQRKEMNTQHSEKLKEFDTSKERAMFAAEQKNKLDAFDTLQQNQTAELSHQLDIKKSKQDSDIEDTFGDKNAALERNIRARDAMKKIDDDVQDRILARQNAEQSAMFQHRSQQRELEKTLRTGMIGASSGMDRIKAMDDYRRDSHMLDQKNQIEANTREEIERAKYNGADEQEINRIQLQSEEMIALLEDQNEISKTMRDKYADGSGGLRGLIQKEAGTVEDMMGAWERIQQSAFNHITDPAADAVIQMDRNEALRFAQQMSVYKDWFPKMVKSNTGLASD